MKDEDAVEFKETKKKEIKYESGTKKKSYECKSCKLIFKKITVLKKHEKQHEQDEEKDPGVKSNRSKSNRSIKTHTKNQHGNESIKQFKHVNDELESVSQCQSKNEYGDSTFDGSDVDEEYSDDTVTSGDDVTGSSFSEPLSFGEEEEKSEVEVV